MAQKPGVSRPARLLRSAPRVDPSRVGSPLASAAEYVPRRPHDTVRYGIIREHLATFLARTERTYAVPLPKYGVDAFEHHLACGDVAAGFLRCHCEGCGHDVLVAFSCKHRGPWPRRSTASCTPPTSRCAPGRRAERSETRPASWMRGAAE